MTVIPHELSVSVQAVTAMVQQAMQYIDQTPDLETRIELIKALNNVSAGKVYMCLKASTTSFQIIKWDLLCTFLFKIFMSSVACSLDIC